MTKFATLLLLTGLVAMLAGAAAPVLARSPRSTPLYANTVEMRFAGPDGKTRTITEQVYIDAGHDCSSLDGTMEQYKHPELASMKLVSVTCHDSAGASRPGGPAIVLLKFVTVNGKLQTAAVDHQGSTPFDMKTCPFVLHQSQSALVAQAQPRFPGGRFVGASCMARPKYINSFLNGSN